jgi:general secretion pathway protein M
MKSWFDSLAPRERTLVLAAAAVAGAAIFFLAVWEPLDRAVDAQRERVERERSLAARMADVRARAETLRGDRPRTPTRDRDESLLSLVDQTGREAGLGEAVRRIQPESDDRAAVTLEGAGFNELVFWLRDLERRYGIRPTALTVNRGEKPGTVSARLTLQRGAA